MSFASLETGLIITSVALFALHPTVLYKGELAQRQKELAQRKAERERRQAEVDRTIANAYFAAIASDDYQKPSNNITTEDTITGNRRW